jgi:hypothetical protein
VDGSSVSNLKGDQADDSPSSQADPADDEAGDDEKIDEAGDDEKIDESGRESFPASDPPAF